MDTVGCFVDGGKRIVVAVLVAPAVFRDLVLSCARFCCILSNCGQSDEICSLACKFNASFKCFDNKIYQSSLSNVYNPKP